MAVESALRIPDAFRLARVSSAPCATSASPSCGVDDDVLFLGAVAYDPFQWMYEAGAVYVYGTAVDCGALRDDVFGRMFFNNAAAGADAGPLARAADRRPGRERRAEDAPGRNRPSERAPGRAARGRAARGADASRAQVMATLTAFWFEAPLERLLWEIDRTGSIYVHRWGDAPIQTAAVRLFAPTTAHARLPVLSYVHLSGKDYADAARAAAATRGGLLLRGPGRRVGPTTTRPARGATRPRGADFATRAPPAAGRVPLGRRAVARPRRARARRAPLADRVRFYTALYHAHLGPTLFGDAADGGFKWGGEGFPFGAREGRLRVFHAQRGAGAAAGARARAPRAPGRYSTFSLWDTYRAQHPLLNLLHPRLARDVAESLLLKAEDAEHSTVESLPRWQLFGMETFCMRRRARARAGAAGRWTRARARRSGYPGVIVLADAVLKNAVSHALEVAVADACASRVAARLGDARLAATYAGAAARAAAYWDAPRRPSRAAAAGAVVRKRLDAYDATGHGGESLFEEGTPLQYSLMRYFFNSTSDGGPDAPVDLETGYVGGHCHGNEPGHHAPYLFNAAGRRRARAGALDRIAALYTARDDGLPGNDDVGQTSACAPVADAHGGGTLTFVLGLEPGDWTRY
ncbi:glycosyl hydrolase family 92 protein [Aureococcus anophagefferens]|uniref:Glycosyl hydrolase family 92 protein n=1 Tax=Aureococcus anophagefferens TaxID=44056 RepID=A0ABR1G583_AURAN